jgi:hypothetical protein
LITLVSRLQPQGVDRIGVLFSHRALTTLRDALYLLEILQAVFRAKTCIIRNDDRYVLKNLAYIKTFVAGPLA